jgi:Zn-dependent peptidase ImmA (M78 family)
MNRQANASAKSKELQPNAQADTVAAHLLLPNRTTTLLLTPLI